MPSSFALWFDVTRIVSVSLLTIVGLVICIGSIVHRKYLPLRARDVTLLCILQVAEIIVLVMEFLDGVESIYIRTYGELTSPVSVILTLFTVQVQVGAFGIYSICIVLRLNRKFVIFWLQDKVKLREATFNRMISFWTVLIPGSLYVLATQILDAVGYNLDIRSITRITPYLLAVGLIVVWLIGLALAVIIRNIRKDFNEFYQTILLLVMLLVYVVMLQVFGSLGGTTSSIGKIVLRLVTHYVEQLLIVLLVGKPLWYCLLPGEKAKRRAADYEAEFRANLTTNTVNQLLSERGARELFLKHCRAEYCEESAQFLYDVIEFKAIPERSKEELAAKARVLYDMYIANGSVRELNITNIARDEILATIQQHTLNHTTFSQVQKEMEMLLSDTLRRFIRSPAFGQISIERRRGLLEQAGMLDEEHQQQTAATTKSTEIPLVDSDGTTTPSVVV